VYEIRDRMLLLGVANQINSNCASIEVAEFGVQDGVGLKMEGGVEDVTTLHLQQSHPKVIISSLPTQ
jgi:hypothetical protein